jgi:hypothetical protein
MVLGGYAAINQFLIKKYIKKINRLSINKMIDEIGKQS